MQPDVSVVIAAYNAQATIARAIHSALGQEGVSVEAIVADDRSADSTAEIVGSFPEPQVRLVSLPQNLGPGGARNAAMEAAGGRWIAVLDSDDAMRPDRLRRMIARCEAQRAEIAVDNLQVVDEGSDESRAMFAETALADLSEITLADYIGSNVIFKSTFNFGYMKPVFERNFLTSVGLRYDERLRIGEDYIFLASALARGGRCVVEPSVGYVYHIREGSISRVLEPRHVADMIAADATFLRGHDLDAAAKKAFDRRRRSLDEAASFLSLVGHLKDRAPIKALGVALKNPAAVRHLGMPIAVRLQRLAAPFTAARQT